MTVIKNKEIWMYCKGAKGGDGYQAGITGSDQRPRSLKSGVTHSLKVKPAASSPKSRILHVVALFAPDFWGRLLGRRNFTFLLSLFYCCFYQKSSKVGRWPSLQVSPLLQILKNCIRQCYKYPLAHLCNYVIYLFILAFSLS